MKSLDWTFDGQGEWEARSSLAVTDTDGDVEDFFTYRIQVCDDGTFDVSRSDAELALKGIRCLKTLATAKEVCEIRDFTILASARGGA